MSNFSKEEAEEILKETVSLLEKVVVDSEGNCFLDYYRLRLAAVLESKEEKKEAEQ